MATLVESVLPTIQKGGLVSLSAIHFHSIVGYI